MANSNNRSSFGFDSGESTIVNATQQTTKTITVKETWFLSISGCVELKSRVLHEGDPSLRKGTEYFGNLTFVGTEYFEGPVVTLQCNQIVDSSVCVLVGIKKYGSTCQEVRLYFLVWDGGRFKMAAST